MTPKALLIATAVLASLFIATRKFLMTTAAVAPLTFVLPAGVAEFDHSHSALTDILKAHVKNELVDYASLKGSPAALEAYVGSLAAVRESEFSAWPKERRLAFFINLYNAATIKLVTKQYPIKSIKDIGNALKGPWDQPVVPPRQIPPAA